jgi:single-stranded-DNA-specific exonuclease
MRVDARDIGYVLGPRLNAAGRLAHARLALDLLLERDEGRAAGMALELAALNRQRQQATAEAVELAMELVALEDPHAPLVFIGHPAISSGIVGLVAGRLVEELYRPAVVYEQGPVTSRASCRSVPEFDITAALRRCSHLMLRFGGHRAAAGFTAENGRLPELKTALLVEAQRELAGLDLAPVIDIDAQIPLHMVGASLQRGREGSLLAWLARMAPFGEGNPEPVFLSRGLEVIEAKRVGAPSPSAANDGGGPHLRLKLRDPEGLGLRAVWPAIAFGRGADGVAQGDRIDAVYTFSSDNMVGATELRIIDLAPAAERKPA